MPHSIHMSIIIGGRRDLLLLIFRFHAARTSFSLFLLLRRRRRRRRLYSRQLDSHWLSGSSTRATNRDHSNYPFRSTTGTMTSSARGTQREGGKERRIDSYLN